LLRRDAGADAAEIAEHRIELRLRRRPGLRLRLLGRVLRGRGLAAHVLGSFRVRMCREETVRCALRSQLISDQHRLSVKT
jgi:hypothetical protein